MGNPAIIYTLSQASPPQVKQILFPEKAYTLQFEYPYARILNRSATKVSETLGVSADVVIAIKMRWLETIKDATLRRQLYQWWEWAIQGYAWAFAADSTRTVWTHLSANVDNFGANTIQVDSAAGIVQGNQYALRSKTQVDVVKVIDISGTTLTLAEALNFRYPTGTRFRDEQYWPALLYSPQGGSQAPPHVVREKPPLHYDVELLFTESVDAL